MPRRSLCFGRKVGREPASSHVPDLTRPMREEQRQLKEAEDMEGNERRKEENEKEVESLRETHRWDRWVS